MTESIAGDTEAMKLRQGLWDVWVALGHDTDGDTGPGALIAGMGLDGFIGMVIRDATTWRRETEDDYANDTDRLEARAKAAEALLESLNEAEERVRFLHREDDGACFECLGSDEEQLPWPCATIKALDGEA